MSDKNKAYYIKTEDGAVHFELTDAGYTFDIPAEHLLEDGGVFVIDDMCECYMTPIDEEENPNELVFVARKGDEVIAIGVDQDDDLNAEIMYVTRLIIKGPKH